MLHFDILQLVETAGYIGLTAIVFAESGLFFGFFFPGDSLLFTAGFLASQGIIHIWTLIPLLIVAAIAGDSVGYWIGRKFGQWLEHKEDTWYYKKEHLKRAEKFYDKHGAKTIFLARFLPIIRTFAPIAAGIASMAYSTFISYNIFGGIFWVLTVSLAGFYLGNIIPNVDQYLYPILAVIIIVSLIPAFWHWYQDRFHSSQETA